MFCAEGECICANWQHFLPASSPLSLSSRLSPPFSHTASVRRSVTHSVCRFSSRFAPAAAAAFCSLLRSSCAVRALHSLLMLRAAVPPVSSPSLSVLFSLLLLIVCMVCMCCAVCMLLMCTAAAADSRKRSHRLTSSSSLHKLLLQLQQLAVSSLSSCS